MLEKAVRNGPRNAGEGCTEWTEECWKRKKPERSEGFYRLIVSIRANLSWTRVRTCVSWSVECWKRKKPERSEGFYQLIVSIRANLSRARVRTCVSWSVEGNRHGFQHIHFLKYPGCHYFKIGYISARNVAVLPCRTFFTATYSPQVSIP